jgi:hypothetical protein
VRGADPPRPIPVRVEVEPAWVAWWRLFFNQGSSPMEVASQTGQSFGWAIHAMKGGQRVCRAGWNGKGMLLILVREWDSDQLPSAVELLPFIAMKTVQGDYVPWLASQTDILAEDWGASDA